MSVEKEEPRDPIELLGRDKEPTLEDPEDIIELIEFMLVEGSSIEE